MDWQDAHMQGREEARNIALADIAAALQVMEHERRNPDAWERVCLVQALTAVFSGCYELATSEARLALITLDQRSPTTNLPHDPILSRCDLPLLMRVLRAAKAEPVKQFPHLGPVVLE